MALHNYGTDQLRKIFTLATEGKVNLALHIACDLGETNIARQLLDAGADIETKDFGGYNDAININDGINNLGFTPVLSAAKAGHMRTVEMLIERGANAKAKTIHNNGIKELGSSAGRPREVPRTPESDTLRLDISAAIAAFQFLSPTGQAASTQAPAPLPPGF